MLVIKRKNLIVGLLVVLLIIAGYLNFLYNQNTLSTMKSDDSKKNITENRDQKDKDTTAGGNKDDAIAVSSSNFFIDYRFERQQVRGDEIDYINTIINNPEADKEIKNEAQKQLLELTENMEKEMAIETLIKSKGFDDVVAIINSNSISVIVNKPELEPDEVAKILDIVTTQTGEKAENIKIIPKI